MPLRRTCHDQTDGTRALLGLEAGLIANDPVALLGYLDHTLVPCGLGCHTMLQLRRLLIAYQTRGVSGRGPAGMASLYVEVAIVS